MAKTKDKTKQPPSTKESKDFMNPQRIRFVHLYLGSDGGKCWSNATLSYLWAFNGDNTPSKTADGQFTPQYQTARTEGCKLLTNPSIQRYVNDLLLEVGYKPETIKKGIAKWATQEKNPVVALKALENMAKITGVMKDDSKVVDLPQIVALTEAVKHILTPPEKRTKVSKK